MEAQTLILLAPVSGFTLPIEEVPDPVFAGKMVGDGIAIDPISQCGGSCDGAVVQIIPPAMPDGGYLGRILMRQAGYRL